MKSTFLPSIAQKDLPHLSKEQMQSVDRIMTEEFHISLPQMMENAGLQLARLSTLLLSPGEPLLILAGSGGNGGGCLAAARHLHNWGFKVNAALSSVNLSPAAQAQKDILAAMGVTFSPFHGLKLGPYGLILDGLLGYSVKGEIREPVRSMILNINDSGKKVLSLDMPSGMHPDEGLIYQATIKASHTLTLALPKICFTYPVSKSHVGELYLADISVPYEVYRQLGIPIRSPHLFRDSGILHLK